MREHPNGITEHLLGELPRPNPEGLKRAMRLIDVTMLCVSNTPLTVNNYDELKACLQWLVEMKASVANQMQEAEEEQQKPKCKHEWYRDPLSREFQCAACGMKRDYADVVGRRTI